jgi:hypothetical protein
MHVEGRAIAQALSRRLHTAATHVRAQVGSFGICGGQSDTAAGFFSEYFGFTCQFSFHRLFHTEHHLSSRAGTIGQLVADVPSGLSHTPPQETKKKKTNMHVVGPVSGHLHTSFLTLPLFQAMLRLFQIFSTKKYITKTWGWWWWWFKLDLTGHLYWIWYTFWPSNCNDNDKNMEFLMSWVITDCLKRVQ